VKMKIEYGSVESDILFGRHSNIPDCCIKFYTQEWLKARFSTRMNLWDRMPSWGYIPCSKCVETGNRIQVHSCTAECYEFLTEEVGMEPWRAAKRLPVCKNWKVYKGIYAPRCNGGRGCPECWEIYNKNR
jgi:hypothetical protein